MIERKRRNVLIATLGVVALSAGVLSVWPPAFNTEDASGAIGAVQKHRQAQISSKDVILSDQSTANEAKVLFGDQLQDALKLQKIGAELAAISVGNRDALQGAAATLESHQTDLQNRYLTGMRDTLNAANVELQASSGLFAAEKLEGMKSELNAIEKSLGSSESLESAQMEALNSRLGSLVSELQATFGAQERLGRMTDSLNAVVALGKSDSLDNKALIGAVTELNAAAATLEAKGILGVSLANRADHLGAMAIEAKALENVESGLGAMIANKGDFQGNLGRMTESLGAAIANLESMALENMQDRLNAQEQLGASLVSLGSRLGSVSLENRKMVESMTLESFDAALGNARKTVESMDSALQSKAFASRQSELGAVHSHLEALATLGANADLANKAGLGANADLANKAGLGANADLANKAGLGANADLANKAGLGANADLANKAGLGANSDLANKAGLGAKAELGRQAELNNKLIGSHALEGFQSYLGAVAVSLESKGLGSRLGNRQELASQAQELQNKATGLQASFNDE